MNTLADKKVELKKLQKEVEELEAIEREQKEREALASKGYYKPLATATVKYNLYYCGESDFGLPDEEFRHYLKDMQIL